LFPPLYPILDADLLETTLPALALRLAQSGVRLIQIRDKRAGGGKLLIQSKEVLEVLSPHRVRLIVNDRPDVAAIAGATGVHVGQADLPVEEARKLCHPPQWIGVSTHNLVQFREAIVTSADYVAVGPIFPTSTKENPDPVVGIDFIRSARLLTQKPIVAIGGITLDSAGDVFRAGADSVAVIRDLVCAADPAARAGEYLALAERVCKARK
jgi:thiamine-phosphate pyrophosphorylase